MHAPPRRSCPRRCEYRAAAHLEWRARALCVDKLSDTRSKIDTTPRVPPQGFTQSKYVRLAHVLKYA